MKSFLVLQVLLFIVSASAFISRFGGPVPSRAGASRSQSDTQLASVQKKKILGRFEDKFPVTLFRIFGKSPVVNLRDEATQKMRGLRSFDIKIGSDGLVHPAPLDGAFIGPNGASLRPHGINMWDILSDRQADTQVMEIPENTVIPEDLVLLHERGDHYSLQCAKPMTLEDLDERLNQFFASGNFRIYTQEEYFDNFPVTE